MAELPIDRGRLSSLSSTLHDIARELTELADQLARVKRDDAASRLYEAERGLTTASRKLDQVRSILG